MLIAVSKIAGEHGRRTDTLLRSSLTSITSYATSKASGSDSVFCAAVVKLVDGLKQILRDTLEMQRCVVLHCARCGRVCLATRVAIVCCDGLLYCIELGVLEYVGDCGWVLARMGNNMNIG